MPSYLDHVNGYVAYQLTSGASVAGGAGYISEVIDVTPYKYFGIAYCCTGATPHVDIKAYGAISVTDPLSNPPNNEFAIPDNTSAVAEDVSDTNWHITSIQPPPATHIRVAATPHDVGCGVDTTIEIRFFGKV